MHGITSALVLGAAVLAGVVFGDMIEKPLKSATLPLRQSISGMWKNLSRRKER